MPPIAAAVVGGDQSPQRIDGRPSLGLGRFDGGHRPSHGSLHECLEEALPVEMPGVRDYLARTGAAYQQIRPRATVGAA